MDAVVASLSDNENSRYRRYESECQSPWDLINSLGTPEEKAQVAPPLRRLWPEKMEESKPNLVNF